jgi:hypothetical protein
MDILNELKSQAEQIRACGEQDRSTAAKLETRYRAALKPALLGIYSYLNDLIDQLQVVRPEVQCDFRIPGVADPKTATQALPTLNVDSRDNIRLVSLRTTYSIRKLQFSASPLTRAEETRDFLLRGRHVFSDWPQRDPRGDIVGLHFSLDELVIAAGIDIAADIEAGTLRFVSSNMEGFENHSDPLPPEHVDGSWLDRLGRYVLAQGRSPMRLELPSGHRAALQQKLESDRAERERELAELDRAREESEAEERLSTRIQRLVDQARQRLAKRS